MNTFTLLAATGVAALLSSAAIAQNQDYTPTGATPPVAGASAPASVAGNGNWTLRQREDWLNDRINKAHDTDDLDGREADRAHHELDHIRDDENHMRGHHDGQLTDNETTMLEARLDDVAAKIHWAHENALQRPW
jgi:hypothetical protein